MAKTYESKDWREYIMDWKGDPHPVMEPLEKEIEEVDKALQALADLGILSSVEYEKQLFLIHRQTVRERFEIPWTGISPRVQRLLYAINSILKPATMVAMGVFCGNTFISNAGAAIGPGACYKARRLVGIEIKPDEAERARKNVSTIDAETEAEILATDGIEWLDTNTDAIDLLYIDADGSYLPIIQKAKEGTSLRRGSIVLAHNSANTYEELKPYLQFVRDPRNTVESINVLIDDAGLEVSVWR